MSAATGIAIKLVAFDKHTADCLRQAVAAP
jgi:hypothetical protein